MNRFNKISLTVVLVLLMAGPAYPQNKQEVALNQLQVDVINLKQQVTLLQTSMDEKNGKIQSLLEKVFDQVNGLSAGMQKINQTVDSVNSHSDKSAADLRALLNTVNGRVNDLSDSVSALRSQLSSVSQQMTDAKTTSVPLPTSKDALQAAKTDLSLGNYDLAAGEFTDIVSKFPADDSGVIEAQYELGVTYYNQKKYDQAATQFDVFLQKYPDNDKVKGALLYKGLALNNLNQHSQAVKVFQEVITRFPNTVEAANAKTEMGKPAPAARGRTNP